MSFSSILVLLCVSLYLVDAVNPKPVMELLQQQIAKKQLQIAPRVTSPTNIVIIDPGQISVKPVLFAVLIISVMGMEVADVVRDCT